MLKTCLIVLIFGSLLSETMHALTGAPVAKSGVFMLSCSITCVFLYLVIILSQYYYFPYSFNGALALNLALVEDKMPS